MDGSKFDPISHRPFKFLIIELVNRVCNFWHCCRVGILKVYFLLYYSHCNEILKPILNAFSFIYYNKIIDKNNIYGVYGPHNSSEYAK